MIVVSKKRLILSFLIILLSSLIFMMASINLFSETPLKISIEKQEIIYWEIVTLIFQILVFMSIFINHRKLVADLKKIASYKDLNHPQSEKILNQMDEIGKVIHTILNDFNKLLELRLNRITAYNKVLKIVCQEYPEPLLITDTMGVVLGISDKISIKLDLPAVNEIKLNDIFPEIKLAEILVALEKNHDVWKDESGSGTICTPVFDKNGNLNLCIWEFDTSNFAQKIVSIPVNNISKKTFNSFRGLIKKKKNK